MNGTAAATTTAFGDGFGIRQRRGRDDSVGAKTLSSDQQQESSYNSSASAMHRPPPPKVSFSLGTADMTTIAGATGGMGVDDIDSANTMANDGKENSKVRLNFWDRSHLRRQHSICVVTERMVLTNSHAFFYNFLLRAHSLLRGTVHLLPRLLKDL